MAFDAKTFNDAFVAALATETAKNPKAAADAADREISMTSFCLNWPLVRRYALMAASALELFGKPGAAAALRAFITTFARIGMPVLCPPAP